MARRLRSMNFLFAISVHEIFAPGYNSTETFSHLIFAIFATQSSWILSVETGKELLALAPIFLDYFLRSFAIFRRTKEIWRHTFFQNWNPPELFIIPCMVGSWWSWEYVLQSFFRARRWSAIVCALKLFFRLNYVSNKSVWLADFVDAWHLLFDGRRFTCWSFDCLMWL